MDEQTRRGFLGAIGTVTGAIASLVAGVFPWKTEKKKEQPSVELVFEDPHCRSISVWKYRGELGDTAAISIGITTDLPHRDTIIKFSAEMAAKLAQDLADAGYRPAGYVKMRYRRQTLDDLPPAINDDPDRPTADDYFKPGDAPALQPIMNDVVSLLGRL